ncbi:unnamed protein product [Lactuca saligna]|uniref:Uncharacterized protein n=1 Tax=Lactuca saligna TaxID=75948 RepID=A0AA35ZIK2_LACSI|nr:unnamed protein product [Lactuca saligna]
MPQRKIGKGNGFRSNLTLDKQLGKITVRENWEDSVLAAAGMRAIYRARGKMVQLYVVRCGAEAKISLVMALRDHYRGRFDHWEIDLVEYLPLLMSKRHMRELAGLLLVERGNVGSSGPASPSPPTVGVVSPVCSPGLAPPGLPMGVQAGKSSALIRKRTVSVARLLGGTGGILNDRFSVLEQKEIVVAPNSLEASPLPFFGSPLVNLGSGSMFAGAPSSPGGSFQFEKPSLFGEIGTSSHSPSFEAYAPGWVITRDSLLSEDTTAQEWSRCAHPLATMSLLAGQARSRMANGLLYATTQTYTLMVATTAGVCHVGANKRQLKGVVRIINKVIERAEFESGIQGVCQACKALGFEKRKQLGGCSTSIGESEFPDPGRVARRAEEVDATLSSLAEIDFAGLFRLGELDYDDLCQFFHRPNPGGSFLQFEG